LVATLLSAAAGCESYSWSVYNNPLIPDIKQGQDCRVLVFGLGGSVDPTGREAMRLGDITRVRNTEFRVNRFKAWEMSVSSRTESNRLVTSPSPRSTAPRQASRRFLL
jgi:hypothetical protein